MVPYFLKGIGIYPIKLDIGHAKLHVSNQEFKIKSRIVVLLRSTYDLLFCTREFRVSACEKAKISCIQGLFLFYTYLPVY